MVKTTLKVDGMMCHMCETHVNDLIRKNFTVKKVSSSVKTGETVIISEASLDIDKTTAAMGELGYRVLDSSEEPYEAKKGLFSFLKH